MTTHKIGLLLGNEEDWSLAFETILGRLDLAIEHGGDTHRFTTDRITIEPFALTAPPSYDFVIDRLAHWYYHPREWVKKVTLMDGVYAINNPFSFQAMEKHSAYAVMLRLGFKVPETWLIPYKKPVDNHRWAYTSAKYNKAFDIREVAEQIGYPMYMKPFEGGGWVGVSRIEGPDDLERAYDESGRTLMHLQKAVDYDVFTRSLTIGAETMVMKFRPERPMHDRYEVVHDFLDPDVGREVETTGRVVNAFFRWEFNSCESLVAGDSVYPIDYANACPDIAVTSLHYYFPWAISRLIAWSVFCTTTRRPMSISLDPDPWFRVADAESSYAEKVEEYRFLAD
ncbi:MAG: hypothetical protein GEU79_18945, partial [Acidimicrobiia bacterium]|nr:hypothetical protein [Acidimicrobiia bacterium]